MAGGPIVIAIHSFIYLSILSLILLIINPIIPGYEITIKGVVWTILNALYYIIQTMFILLWKNLAPDNFDADKIFMKDELYRRMLYFSNEFVSNLGVIKGLNTSIGTLQTSAMDLLSNIKGLTRGTGEIVRHVSGSAADAAIRVTGTAIDAAKYAGQGTATFAEYAGQNIGTGIEYGRGAVNYGTDAAAAFAGNLYDAAMGININQRGGGNTDMVSTELI